VRIMTRDHDVIQNSGNADDVIQAEPKKKQQGQSEPFRNREVIQRHCSLPKTGEDKECDKNEAKALYTLGCTEGMLSRRHEESMSSYIRRQENWWNQLTSLDPEISLPDECLGGMLLKNACLTRAEHLEVLTLTAWKS